MESLFPLREEQAESVADIVEAAAALLADWARGSCQRTRVDDCGDSDCGYASCRLANAIKRYVALADEESPDA